MERSNARSLEQRRQASPDRRMEREHSADDVLEEAPAQSSQKKHAISFQLQRPPILLRVLHVVGTLALGFIPLGICLLIPAPESEEEQQMFWHQGLWLVVMAIFGLGASVLLWLVRSPSRYSISRTRLHVVSIARTRWWWCPFYESCQGGRYSIKLVDIVSVEEAKPACLLPSFLPGPCTAFDGLCCVKYRSRIFFLPQRFGLFRKLWLSPEDPAELIRALRDAVAAAERGSNNTNFEMESGLLSSSYSLDEYFTTTSKPAVGNSSGAVVNLPPPGIGCQATGPSSDAADNRAPAGTNGSPGTAPPTPKAVHFAKYRVQGTDTLEGLALKFDCKVEDIRRANGFTGPVQLLAYKTVWIPYTGDAPPSPRLLCPAGAADEEELAAERAEPGAEAAESVPEPHDGWEAAVGEDA